MSPCALTVLTLSSGTAIWARVVATIGGSSYCEHTHTGGGVTMEKMDLNVAAISDLIGGASDADDLGQVMAASCTTSSVSTSSSSSSS